MIGIIYTGETESKLIEEISKFVYSNNAKDLKIFVEPSFEKEFNINMLTGTCIDPLKQTHQRGIIKQFIGIDVTNTEDEANKRNVTEVTMQEVADKFGVSKAKLRIKDHNNKKNK